MRAVHVHRVVKVGLKNCSPYYWLTIYANNNNPLLHLRNEFAGDATK